MFGFGTVNKVVLIGYIAKDAKITTFENGRKKISMVVATQKEWVGDDGKLNTTVEWHRVIAYGNNFVDSIFNRALKRNLVYIEGQMKTRKWTKEDGQVHYITEIVIEGEGSKYQTLRKVKTSEELNIVEMPEKPLNEEEKEAKLVDEIEAMLLKDINNIVDPV